VQGIPELDLYVDSLIVSSEVGYRKPHSEFFHAACSRLGLAAHQVLCVGDDRENDVRGAIQAGLSGILIDRAGNRPADLPHVPVLTALVEMRFVQKRPNSRLQSR
jgi:putative hydrolase of the HAD superfamily